MGAHVAIAVVNLSWLMDSVTVRRLFDVDTEATAVAWFSSATLLGIAGLAVLAGWCLPTPRHRVGWWVIGCAFGLLSLDETASLHETAGVIASNYFAVDWLPGGFMWVIVVAPPAAIGAVWMLRWLGKTLGWRSTAGRLAVTAIALWLTVPFFEALAPSLDKPLWLTLTEETTEGFGEALMAGAMVSYLARMRIVVQAEDPLV